MLREEVLEKLNDIFKDVFDCESLVIDDNSTANDIEGWDSLMQMNIIEIVESEFNIQFDMDEILDMENVGAMIDIIMSRI